METAENGPGPSKHGSKGTMPWNIFEQAAKGYVNAQFPAIAEELAYGYRVVLTEIRITRQKDHWRVMIKGVKDNACYVAFVNTLHFDDALEFAVYETRNGTLCFKPDKYPVRA